MTLGSGVTVFNDVLDITTNLRSIYCKSNTPPTLASSYNFTQNNGYHPNLTTIYVPQGARSAYYNSSSGWRNYSIVEYDGSLPAPWESGNEGGNEGETTAKVTVDTNSQWRISSTVANPDAALYDGVYESQYNYHAGGVTSYMYLTIEGLEQFQFYVRSDAESIYDYVLVSELDATINNTTDVNSPSVKFHTRGNQQSGTELSNYTLVKFDNIDKQKHTITIAYRKDSSTDVGADRGYVLIPKQQ